MKNYVLVRNKKGVYIKGFKRRFIKYYLYIFLNKVIKKNEVEFGSI